MSGTRRRLADVAKLVEDAELVVQAALHDGRAYLRRGIESRFIISHTCPEPSLDIQIVCISLQLIQLKMNAAFSPGKIDFLRYVHCYSKFSKTTLMRNPSRDYSD